MPKFRYARIALGLVTLAAVAAVLWQGPIAQDPAYHVFADTRRLAGIDNFGNVLSNLAFALVGAYGLMRVPALARLETRAGYIALCIGVLLVAVGSGWYHLAPSTGSLLWDRLPMTVAFMALFSLLLDERQVLRKPWPTLWPLLLLGIASAVYWYWTESRGAGDLRPYVLVQFLPMLLIPAIVLTFRAEYLSNRLLLAALALYAVSKAFEYFDRPLLEATGMVSGHTLKHLVAAVAVLCIVRAVPTRSGSA